MVGVSASVNLPLHHKVQKFSSGTGSPEWSRKKGRKTVVVCVLWYYYIAAFQWLSTAVTVSEKIDSCITATVVLIFYATGIWCWCVDLMICNIKVVQLQQRQHLYVNWVLVLSVDVLMLVDDWCLNTNMSAVNAPNHIGKSSLLEEACFMVVCFCLCRKLDPFRQLLHQCIRD